MWAFVSTGTDSLHANIHGGEEGEKNLFALLLHHVRDSRELEIPFVGQVHLPHFDPVSIAGVSVDLSITKHVVFLWVAGLLLIVLVPTLLAGTANALCRRDLAT
jgi:hypothetical protein